MTFPPQSIVSRTLTAGLVWAAAAVAAVAARADGPPPDVDPANIVLRGNLGNARLQFERNKAGRVAFMGGSITEMQGYRPLVGQLLQRRFPDTKFTFIDAGISSTCSTTGAFRLAHDVLDQGPVDLFFVEFAVNDDQDAGHAEAGVPPRHGGDRAARPAAQSAHGPRDHVLRQPEHDGHLSGGKNARLHRGP